MNPAASLKLAALAALAALFAPAHADPASGVPAPDPGPQVSLSVYLASARADAALQARDGDRALEFTNWPGLPFLRDMEFRLRNDALDPSNLRYTIRLDPLGYGEWSAARRANHAEVARSRLRDRLLLNRALAERYLLAVDYRMALELRGLNADLLEVLRDRITVLDKRKATTEFDLAGLIEAESELTKVRSQDLETRRDLAVLEQRAALHLSGGAPDPGFVGLDTAGWVDVETVIAEVEKDVPAVDTGHVYLEYLKQGLALAEGRYAMEKAAGNRYLSFVGVSYDVGQRLDEMRRRDDGKDYDLARAYILEAGFRLPFLTEGNAEINRRRAQLRDEKEDYRQRRSELEQSMRKDVKDIGVLVEQYRYLKARENEVDAQASLKKYQQMAGADPLSLLAIKAAELRNRIKIEEAKYAILRNWIRVLDASGRLSREPLRNWLAADGSGVAK
jgi:hypothetical protein